MGLLYSENMKIGHVNLNKLANKLYHVNSLLLENEISILGITQTWLTSEVPDSFVNLDNYKIERADNPGQAAKHGAAVFIRNDTHLPLYTGELPTKECGYYTS